MTFVYTNQISKQTYELSGIVDREHAWKLVNFVAERNGWNEFDIIVERVLDKSETIDPNFKLKSQNLSL
jgi:hypothetical protein